MTKIINLVALHIHIQVVSRGPVVFHVNVFYLNELVINLSIKN